MAADSPEYEALVETLVYALNLAELRLWSEPNAFGSLQAPKAH
ncbi:MAG TPA: hypothetical protein VE691_17790 [Rubrobacter sp.]|nr:hypothetical protein [Rubrobacter sp.]